MSDDRFFERLREDARRLQYEPADDFLFTRLSARIRARIEQPTVTQFLAGWIRPLAASLSALVLAATLGLALLDRTDVLSIGNDTVEVSMGGDVYSVVE